MNLYHDTHYLFYYRILPQMLRTEILNTFIEATRRGEGNAMLVGFWRTAARVVSGVGAQGVIPSEVSLTRNSFAAIARDPASGWTFLVMSGPTVRGPIQAGCAVAAFRNSDPAGTLRYFTLEAPAEPDYPWMVGEWRADGSRSNYGAITDVSTTSAMEDYVARILGLDTIDSNVSQSPFKDTVRGTNDQIDWRNEGARAMREALGGFEKTEQPSTPRESIVTWSSSASAIAASAATDLLNIRASGGKALVMTAASAHGLAQETSSYVQFMWKRNGSLITEIQADYSYWGLSVPSSSWPELKSAGMEMPGSRSANFHQLIPKKISHGELIARLTMVFDAFQSVMQPTGPIETSRF